MTSSRDTRVLYGEHAPDTMGASAKVRWENCVLADRRSAHVDRHDETDLDQQATGAGGGLNASLRAVSALALLDNAQAGTAPRDKPRKTQGHRPALRPSGQPPQCRLGILAGTGTG